jgi:hypothetical protein
MLLSPEVVCPLCPPRPPPCKNLSLIDHYYTHFGPNLGLRISYVGVAYQVSQKRLEGTRSEAIYYIIVAL